MKLVDEEQLVGPHLDVSDFEIENTMIFRANDVNDSSAVTNVKPKQQVPTRIKSMSLSVLTISQIVVALGIWIGSILGLSRSDGLKILQVASLLSTAVFLSAGYIGIRTVKKPLKFRVLVYIGLCITSITYGIVMIAVNAYHFTTRTANGDLLIVELVFDCVEVVLAAAGIVLARRILMTVFAAPNSTL